MNKKLNIWCWLDPKEWYINLDWLQLPWVDVIHDLNKFPYPFEDNYFDEIYSSHVLEHVTDLLIVMRELSRITKNWWYIKVIVPYFTNPGTWADYTHKRAFTVNSFNYFTKDCFYHNWLNLEVAKIRIHYFWNRKSFMDSSGINLLPDLLINISQNIYERFFAYIFPSCEIHYLLKINK